MKSILSLSETQKGIIFETTTNNLSWIYLTQARIDLKEKVNLTLLQQAWNKIVARHEILRATIKLHNDDHILYITDKVNSTIELVDITSLSPNKRKGALAKLDKNINKPLNLFQAPLMRLKLIKLDSNNYRLLWTHHHVLLAAQSCTLVFAEFMNLYDALLKKQKAPIFIKLTKYSEYQAHLKTLQTSNNENGKKYWQDIFTDFACETLPTTTFATKNKKQTKPPKQIPFVFTKTETAKLKHFAFANGITLNILIQAAWGILLARYSGLEDIAFGTVRALPPNLTKNLAGMFINTLPLRLKINAQSTINEILNNLRNQNKNLKNHLFTSLAQIKTWAKINNQTNFIDTAIDFKPQSPNDILKSSVKNWENRSADFISYTNYPIILEAYVEDEQLYCRINYQSHMYADFFIKQMTTHLKNMLFAIINNPNEKAVTLSYLASQELEKILYTWNDTYAPFPQNKTVHQLFEEQAEKTPHNIAIIYEDKKITYRELNKKANQLAHYLREKYKEKFNKDLPPNTLIALCLERNIETIISILGIIKAGGAYVPIDPNDAKNRKKQMLQDSKPSIILSDKNTYREFKTITTKSQIFNINVLFRQLINTHKIHNPVNINSPQDAIYVIYTSGSTGLPKGIIIPHHAVVRLVKNTNYVQLSENNKIAQASTTTFDAATFEIWGTLLNGATTVIIPKMQLLNNSSLLQTIRHYHIDTMFLTTELFNSIVKQNPNSFGDLTYLLMGGEKINPLIIKKIIAAKKQPKHLLHVYGPTENTTFSTFYTIPQDWTYSNPLPIGKPIANSTTYILDKYQQPVPIGICGELYTGGKGVALRYLNDQARTNKHFVSNPWDKNKLIKMYKTGDLVRWLKDGNIEFVDRIDNQIKLRGFRIELEEIAINLGKYKNIKQAVVLCNETINNNKQLVAFIVLRNQELETSPEDIIKFLGKSLPNYMIPSLFIKTDSIPLTSSGKIDKKKLLALHEDDLTTIHKKQSLPQNKTQKTIANVWGKILNRKNIDIYANLFDLGAHSLLLAQACNILHKELQKNIQIVDFFNHPTIASFATFLEQEKKQQINSFTKEQERATLKKSALTAKGYYLNEHKK